MTKRAFPLRRLTAILLTAVAGVLGLDLSEVSAQSVNDWPVHSVERPVPPVIVPGPASASVPPPSDATVLFGGRDLSQWRSDKGAQAGWKVSNGYFEVVPGAGGIRTARSFGDSQLHIEWAAPSSPTGEGQGRGNSGVFFGDGRYEVQVLDSYQNPTYADGQAAALYGQYPPLVNASRRPGEWQTYDIIFRGPHFDQQGKLLRPVRVTVLHNGVLVQDNATLVGPTAYQARPPYEAHPERLPISLQDHGDPVRFRNVWIRELNDVKQPE